MGIRKQRIFLMYWLPLIISLCLLLGLILQSKFYPGCLTASDRNYILSSITQGLASLLALLFVIVFFICQSTGRFSTLSHIMKEPFVKLLLYLFVFTIILPLLIIKIGSTHMLIDLSIFFSILCLLFVGSLIFYAMDKINDYGIFNTATKIEELNFPKDNSQLTFLIYNLTTLGTKRLVEIHQEATKVFLNKIPQLINKMDSNTDITSTMDLTVEINIYSMSNLKVYTSVFTKSFDAIQAILFFLINPASNINHSFTVRIALKDFFESICKYKEKEEYRNFYFILLRDIIKILRHLYFNSASDQDLLKQSSLKNLLEELLDKNLIEEETYKELVEDEFRNISGKHKRADFREFMMSVIPSNKK